MKKNRFQANTTVALTDDVPIFGLIRDDIAEILEILTDDAGGAEMIVKVVNAHGDVVAVFPVKESQIREVRHDEILHVRRIQIAALAEPLRRYHSVQKLQR